MNNELTMLCTMSVVTSTVERRKINITLYLSLLINYKYIDLNQVGNARDKHACQTTIKYTHEWHDGRIR